MKYVWQILTVLALLGGGVWYGLSQLRATVLTAEAVQGTAVDAVTGTVKVRASIDLNLKTQVPGRIAELFVEVGQRIEEGAPVAKLGSTELEHRLKQLKIRLQAAQARQVLPFAQERDIASAQEDIESLELSVGLGGASESQVEARRRDLEKSMISLEAERISRWESAALIEAQIKQGEYELERMTVYAPMAGEVVEILAWPGDWLWAGSAIIRLISDGRIVEMTLSEENFFGTAIGQRAELHLASFPDRTLQAEVTNLASTADAEAKTRNVWLKVEAGNDVLIPGLTGEGILYKDQRAGATIIPRRALIGNLVYVVNDSRVDIRRVEPGYLSLNKAEVLSGLVPGDRVILEDQSLRRQDENVIVVQAD